MVNVGIHEDLYNFFADLWNSAVQTGGNSRYLRSLNCWLESCTYEDLPGYMKGQYDRGRVIIYPLFPKYAYEDMGYNRWATLAQIKKRDKKQKGLWAALRQRFITKRKTL